MASNMSYAHVLPLSKYQYFCLQLSCLYMIGFLIFYWIDFLILLVSYYFIFAEKVLFVFYNYFFAQF